MASMAIILNILSMSNTSLQPHNIQKQENDQAGSCAIIISFVSVVQPSNLNYLQ